jgi:DNA-binding NarL/FixJ family response regulator
MSYLELPLTPRHREIAVLMAEGRTLDEIARMLTVTPTAVANDMDYLVRRLDRVSRANVAAWVARRAVRSLLPEARTAESGQEPSGCPFPS